MPNCTKCGQPLKDGAAFCTQCGAAVRNCLTCGKPLKEGVAFCTHCGAAVNEVNPDSGTDVSRQAAGTGPVAAQAAATLGWVRFTLLKPFFGSLMNMLEETTNTIVVDGNVMRTIQMGETVEFEVPVGMHTIQIVHSYRNLSTLNMPVTRESNALEFIVEAGTLPVVEGVYNNLTWNFSLHLR